MKCTYCNCDGPFTEGEHDEDYHELLCDNCGGINYLNNKEFVEYCDSANDDKAAESAKAVPEGHTVPVWFRLGCTLQLTGDEIKLLAKSPYLVDWNAVFARGVQPNGDTYPYNEDMGLDDRMATEISPDKTATLFPKT